MADDRLRRMISGAAARLEPGGDTVFAAVDVHFAQEHDERMQSRSCEARFAMDQRVGTQLAFSGSYE
ncbi:MAG: hypothetical protein M0P42_15635 [Gallionella sp.]|jgi:hypothetical protein|nr:hypothetical protein [Gallionella sp.]